MVNYFNGFNTRHCETMKIPKLIMIISLSTVCILEVLSTSETFQMTRMFNGSQACSDEMPNVTLYLSQLPSLDSSANSCLPPSVRCSWECASDPSCTNFNYETDPGSCELFYYTPTICSANAGCGHFQVPGLNSCIAQENVVCPPGFLYLPEANGCYKVMLQYSNWSTTKKNCEQLHIGAYLSIINSSSEQKAIETFLDKEIQTYEQCQKLPNGYMIWLGGQTQDVSTCERFVWKLPNGNTAPMMYTNWVPGQPDCTNTNEHCVHIWEKWGTFGQNNYYHYGWNDYSCSSLMCGLCEYRVS